MKSVLPYNEYIQKENVIIWVTDEATTEIRAACTLGVVEQNVGTAPYCVLFTKQTLLFLRKVYPFSYHSILLSWAKSSTFIMTCGQRVSSKSSHLERNLHSLFTNDFQVLDITKGIIYTYTRYHTS